MTVFFLLSFSVPVIYLCYAYSVDPLKLFRESGEMGANLNRDDRVRAAQILRATSFDSIVLGSSMLKRVNENSISDARHSYANLSTTGSTVHERIAYLEYVFRERQLKAVIFSLDHGLSLHRRAYPINMNPENWMYLFDASKLNDLKIYLEEDYVICLLRWLTKDCMFKKTSIKKSNNSYEARLKTDLQIAGLIGWQSPSGRWKAVKSRISRIVNDRQFVVEDTTDYQMDLVKLRELVAANKDTYFQLVIPPYSKAYLTLLYRYNPKMRREYINFLSDVHTNFQGLDNVNVILIDGDSLTEDLNNYIDMRHFIGPVTDKLVSSIRKRENFLEDDQASRIRSISQSLENFQITELLNSYEVN